MAATNAKKLENLAARDAARQARRRERMLANGKPDTQVCDRALVEALAFTLAITPAIEATIRSATIRVSTLTDTALAILVDREGYRLEPATNALKLRLTQRDAHRDPSYTPSLVPDPIMQMERMVRSRNARLLSDITSGDD